MPRKRDPKRKEAFEIWKKHNGNITNRAIAEELKIPEKTIGGWKSKDKWNEKLNGVLQTKIRSTPNKKATKKTCSLNDKEAKETIVESDELTDKQRLFCMYYVKYWNAGKAAKKAGYECNYSNGFYEIGYQLLQKTPVKNKIDELKKNIAKNTFLETMAVLQKYIDIAFSDITDFVEFGREEVADDLGNPYEVNRVKFRESSEVDGTLITEIKQGKDGVSVKLADKMKALDFLSKYTDLLNENDRKKLQEEKTKMEIEKTKADIARIKGEEDETEDDGFIDALKAETEEVWTDDNET